MIEFIYTVIKAVCDYFQEQKNQERLEETKGYIYESKEYMNEIRDYMKISTQELACKMLDDLRTKDRDKIRSMVQELIRKGEFDLAYDLNRLLGENFRLSEESFSILKGYLGR